MPQPARRDFLLFTKAYGIINTKEHLTEGGLTKLVSIRANLNQGLPERLKAALPNLVPVPRPQLPKIHLDSNTPVLRSKQENTGQQDSFLVRVVSLLK